ncbi:MAG: YkvA family protein [Gammaproteobacteria bacterium]|nr:YkvA family protein [Gammaproteobacteria bacterium]MCZ6827605.1 YkvA family protein [Gammaproteobacteria bacterium]MCZ6913001.1 YkvA family protein [Pseudomonadota bacterium]
MSLRITFELGESDLKHFRTIMRESRAAAKNLPAEEIIASANQLLDEVRSADAPDFISERLMKLEIMLQMIQDKEWKLPQKEVTRILNALAYFSEPEDLIPDHIPGLGFLDDAIMVELVVRELRHEIEAYEDFCKYRATEESRRRKLGKAEHVSREEWLKQRRISLQQRMRRRRRRDRSRRSGSSRSPFSLL